MAWALLDVGFHDHPKILALVDEPDGLAAIGLWTMCLAWAKGHCDPDNPATAGRIPVSLVRRLGGSELLAKLLVKAGLWEADGDDWVIHEFAGWQQLEAWRVKRLLGKSGGRPRRSEPSGNHMGTHTQTIWPPISQSHDMTMTGHDTHVVDTSLVREDVERLCEQLADRIEANGSKRPSVGKVWRDAARLMIDKDGRTEEQVRKAIDWCQGDEFWRANILSMPKLRQQYDKLRLAAQRGKQQSFDKPPIDPRAEHMMRR